MVHESNYNRFAIIYVIIEALADVLKTDKCSAARQRTRTRTRAIVSMTRHSIASNRSLTDAFALLKVALGHKVYSQGSSGAVKLAVRTSRGRRTYQLDLRECTKYEIGKQSTDFVLSLSIHFRSSCKFTALSRNTMHQGSDRNTIHRRLSCTLLDAITP